MGSLDAGGAVAMIGDLIDSFFAALKESSALAVLTERSAEMAYELDQVVSTYLEEHELSPQAYHQIEQEVLNTIAADLQHAQPDVEHFAFSYDADGNVDPVAVFAALDHQLNDWLHPDPAPASDLDAAFSFDGFPMHHGAELAPPPEFTSG